MGRRPPSDGGGGGDLSRRPTFLNSDAFYNARGSGLDWLERYGPNRGQRSAGGGSQATYGGRPASGQSSSIGSVGSGLGGSITDSAFGGLATENPYTALTGDSNVGAVQPMNSPQSRYNSMVQEQEMLAAEGLEAGRAAANQVRQLQDQAFVPALTQTPSATGIGVTGTGRYGTGTVNTQGTGPSRSFGRFNSPSPEADRQAELGEKAIANRRKAGVSEQSLLDSYYRRFGR
jgi:hypothetical protein